MEAYILIVQEDFTSQQLLKQFLTSNGYNVDCADDGLEGIHMYKENDYDLIILGVNLPNLDGFSVCTMIRRESQIPIIFVTRANTEEDQIRGFELLCDDYITKPFSYKLLLKRVEAVLRRAKIEQKESYIEFEKIKLNLKTYSVEIDDESVDLTLKELGELLDPPISKSGVNHRLKKIEDIANELWSKEFDNESNDEN